MATQPIDLSILIVDRFPLTADTFERHKCIVQALKPLLEWLERYEFIKIAFQFSWGLQEAIFEMEELQEKISFFKEEGRIEFLCGSPVHALLHTLPQEEAEFHIERDRQFLEKKYNAKPVGFSPYGLCWDNDLIPLLNKKSISYCMVDRDSLTQVAGWTERAGVRLGVVGADHALSKSMPFKHPRAFFIRLQELALRGDTHAVAIWTLEDFGYNSGSYERCWSGMHMDQLAKAMRQTQAWFKMCLPRQIIDAHSTRVYPVPGRRKTEREFVPWERDLALYPAVGQIQAYSSLLSSRTKDVLDLLKKDFNPGVLAHLEEVRDALFFCQSALPRTPNPLGSLEDPEERHRIWKQIELGLQSVEQVIDGSPKMEIMNRDLDCDGHDEIWVKTPHFRLNITPRLSSYIPTLSLFGAGNILNVLGRHRRPWHDRLPSDPELPSLIHDLNVSNSDEIDMSKVDTSRFYERLAFDSQSRGLFVDMLFDKGLNLSNLKKGMAPIKGLFSKKAHQLIRAEKLPEDRIQVESSTTVLLPCGESERTLSIRKLFTIYGRMPLIEATYTFHNQGMEPINTQLGIGFNFNIDGKITPERYFFVEPHPVRCNLLKSGFRESVESATWRLGGCGVELQAWPPARAYFHPIETPILRSRGVDMQFQVHSLLCVWD